MRKGYVKDSNGKFHLVDKVDKNQEPIIAINQQRLGLGPLTMEELDLRLKRVESFLFLAGVKK
jgi:hypothetical protein